VLFAALITIIVAYVIRLNLPVPVHGRRPHDAARSVTAAFSNVLIEPL